MDYPYVVSSLFHILELPKFSLITWQEKNVPFQLPILGRFELRKQELPRQVVGAPVVQQHNRFQKQHMIKVYLLMEFTRGSSIPPER